MRTFTETPVESLGTFICVSRNVLKMGLFQEAVCPNANYNFPTLPPYGQCMIMINGKCNA